MKQYNILVHLHILVILINSGYLGVFVMKNKVLSSVYVELYNIVSRNPPL